MPSHKIHRALDSYVFGKKHEDVHRALDITAYKGPRHRKDQTLLLMMIALQGSPEKTKAGILHIALDQAMSSLDPKIRNIIDPPMYRRRRR